MFSLTEFVILFLMTTILVMFIQNHYGEVEYVFSKIDQREYLVRKLPDKVQAADYLATLNKKLMTLIKHMMAKYPQNEDVKRLYKNYNPDSISEGSIESGYTSYSVNKGEKLIFCIRQKDQSFVQLNVILYVAIHELAHIMTVSIGHDNIFWENFKWLLKEAISINVYQKIDFNSNPEEYCGIAISNSVI